MVAGEVTSVKSKSTNTSCSAVGRKRVIYTSREKPEFLTVDPDGFPDFLLREDRWVTWKPVWDKEVEEWKKKPLRLSGEGASVVESGTRKTAKRPPWVAFDPAYHAYKADRERADGPPRLGGIGFVLGGGYVGIDLDDVRDPVTGVIERWAGDLIDATGGHVEVSPTGTGVKLVGRGAWPVERGVMSHPSGVGKIEVYHVNHYFCMTGRRIEAGLASDSIQPALDALAQLFAAHAPPPVTAASRNPGTGNPDGGCPLSDDEVVERIRQSPSGPKFAALFDRGDASGYGRSEADMSLCLMLPFWVGCDADRIERIVRRSALARKKWDDRRGGRTLLRMNIDKAIGMARAKGEFFDWPPEGTKSPAVTGGHRSWSAPIPLARPSVVPPFPDGILPAWAADYTSALATAIQVPPDIAAMLVLGVAAGGIARKVVVTPWGDWTEPTNLFVMCGLQPGERKSQTFTAVLAPVVELERELRREEAPRLENAASAFRVAERRVEKLERDIVKCADPDTLAQIRIDLLAATTELSSLTVPAATVFRVDNATPEPLEEGIVAQGGRLMAASAEPQGLVNMSAYSDATRMDVFLKGHAGDFLDRERMGKKRLEMDRPALTCVYTPQPGTLASLFATPELRSRGFTARWFFSLPESRVGYREARPAPTPAAVRERYADLMTRLWKVGYADADGEPHELLFTPEAADALEAFERRRESRMRPDGDLAGLAGWGNKLGGLCVRLCGVLHAMDGIADGDGWQTAPVPAEVVSRAVRLCEEYATPHAVSAFETMGATDEATNARRVWKWIARQPGSTFTLRDAFDKCRNQTTLNTVDEMGPALALLERHFLIRPAAGVEPRKGPGRPPSPVYEINPAARSDAEPDRG